jgi:hypothetical protein
LSLLGLVLPRLAESAAPAAFCCAADFAGMIDLLMTRYVSDQRGNEPARSQESIVAISPAKRRGEC